MKLGRQCRAKSKRSGRRCQSPAVRGYDVCRMHGAGTRKRVKEGKRQSPRLAPIKTGEYTSPRTEAERRILDPEYARCLEEVRQNPDLMNMDEMAARIYASLRSLDYRKFETPAERDEALKSISHAISRVEQVRMASRGKGNDNMRKLCIAVAQVLREFVPPERLRGSLTLLRTSWNNLTGEGDVIPTLPGN